MISDDMQEKLRLLLRGFSERRNPMTEQASETLLREILEKGFGGEGDLRTLRDCLAAKDCLALEDWEALLRDGSLSGEVLRLGRAMAELYAPWVWAALLSETREGSIPAMKLYFELCKGRDTAREGEGGMGIDGGIQALRKAIFAGPGSGAEGIAGNG